MTTKRVIWPDVIRIFAIFLVVVTHVVYIPSYPSLDFLTTLFISIVPTCVPLFVMISGALLLSKKETTLFFLKKRTIKLIPPWIFWVGVYVLIGHYLNERLIPTEGLIKYLAIQFMSRLWFLPLIASLYLVTPFLRLFIEKVKIYYTILLVVLWFVIVIMRHLLDFLNGKGFSELLFIQFIGYYLLGYLLSKIKSDKRMITLSIIFIIITTIVTAWLSTSGIVPDLFLLNYASPTTVVLSSFIFILIQQLLINRDKKISKKAKKMIFSLGSAAFGIYLIHELIYKIFTKSFPEIVTTVLDKLPILSSLLSAVILFILSFFFILILKRIPIVKHIVP